MKPALLLFKGGRRVECLVPDQSIYPQFVRKEGRVFIYHNMSEGRMVYCEVDAPEAD